MTQSTVEVTARRSGQSSLERYGSGIRFVAPIMPATASGAMFIAYLLPSPLGRDGATSVLIGLVAAAIVGIAGGWIAIPFVRDRDRSRAFLELWERCQRLEARLEVAKGIDRKQLKPDERAAAELAVNDVERIVARLRRTLDDKDGTKGSADDASQLPGADDWSNSGAAHVGLWQLIHAAEEALLIVEPLTEVIAQALTDRRRLIGSTIPQAPALLAMQSAAVSELDPAIAASYFAATTETVTGGPGK